MLSNDAEAQQSRRVTRILLGESLNSGEQHRRRYGGGVPCCQRQKGGLQVKPSSVGGY